MLSGCLLHAGPGLEQLLRQSGGVKARRQCAGDESLLRRGLSAGSDRNCWRAGSLAEGDFHSPDAVTVAFLLVLLSVRYFVEFLYECRINVNNNNQTPQACAVSAHHICPCDVSASCRAAELRVSRPAPISP